MACDFGAEGLCLIFLQTLHMKSNFVTFVPCNWFVIFFSNLDKYFMKNVNISYQQLFEDLQCYFCQFLPRYKIGMEIDICDCIDLIITHFNSLKVPSSPLVTLKASVWVTKFKCCNSVWWKYLFNTLFRFGMARNLAWLTFISFGFETALNRLVSVHYTDFAIWNIGWFGKDSYSIGDILENIWIF